MREREGLTPPDSAAGSVTRCGYVALVAAPNVGKSTLMNALVGEELSIVTPKAQTTWTRVTGIRTSGRHQLVFLDTPGLLNPSGLFQRSFRMQAERAVAEADVVLVVVDPLHPLDEGGRARLASVADASSAPRIGIVNKVDVATAEAIEVERRWISEISTGEAHLVSGRKGDGLDDLLRAVETFLPEAPFLYPEDDLATAPTRFFVAEMVREAIFRQFYDEVPYCAACRVEEFRDDGDRTYIQATIYVERRSQKGILIGEKGASIRSLGVAARRRIEHFLGRPVYLDLWVKVLPGWRRRPDHLRRLGFPVPSEDRAG